MSEELVIRHCSPTLAGMKTASMFTYRYKDSEELKAALRRWNKMLVKKGLRVLPLRCRENRALIYMYRPARLHGDLQHCTACRLMGELGYSCTAPERCIRHLKSRLSENGDFPHEIGFFLGYPPEDVCGFIEQGSAGSKYTGLWQVYGDVATAQKLFNKYTKCTCAYIAQLEKGKSIEKLTLAV